MADVKTGGAALEAAEADGHGTNVWYCPVCGYIDPKTRNVRCPKNHPGGRRPMFREAVFGYFVRVGIEEMDDA